MGNKKTKYLSCPISDPRLGAKYTKIDKPAICVKININIIKGSIRDRLINFIS